MRKVAFYTLGCKVNQYETEALTELFEDSGYETVAFSEKADVYIINTCTVTGLSARKSRQMIRRAKTVNAEAIVAVVGCYPQTSPDEAAAIPGVDIVIGTKDRARILEYIDDVRTQGGKVNAVSNIMKNKSFEELHIDRYKGRTRAFIKIQDGCSQFCSYCIIPYARGPVRSRPPEDIMAEVLKLADKNFKEVVLTGIHIASYGKDLKNVNLLELIKGIHNVEGISRIRLGSIEPSTITGEFAAAAGNLEKLCPHYHISLQSGCNETLKRMNRKYTVEEYGNVIKLLRDSVKDAAFTTDIMVGFPGETDEEFEKTYKFLEEISFAQMHVFKFSPRKGTPAAMLSGQVDSAVKEERSERVLRLSTENMLKFNMKYIGRTMPVLFEQEVKIRAGFYEGLTSNYIRVLCKGNDSIKGRIMETSLAEANSDYILGEIQSILKPEKAYIGI
ncbi:MAG: tRNA (N(6)-L-threonylcarbamoyladenosine(37)-C(2))-methylthiotransferase MtaB [Ruminiclostridium sp.]|nr:tRNA (N(6)-L-threonylcarbamoyladenosine(37)-C(2))-methylthiotransferase MtaB [Ruminiclostridium sp.]